MLCGLTLLVSIAASSELRHRLLALDCVLGLAIVVLLSAPPFVYHYVRFGHEYVTGYVLDENVLLFTI